MKISLFLVPVVLVCMATAKDPAYSESSPQPSPATSRQWVSHQMNQPPPDPSERYRISDDMLDEIRELYALAQKELEAKKQNKPKDSK